MEEIKQYDVGYELEKDMFFINDTLRGEIIIIRTEQLEELIKKWAEIFAYNIEPKENKI